MTRKSIAPFILLACLALPPSSPARVAGESWSRAASGPQWATVNVCSPGEVGVRASLPGDGGAGAMAARFTLQWLNPATQAWENVRGAPVSPWVDAGPADVLWSQVGFTFQVDPAPPGARFTMRGVAELRLGSGAVETLVTPNTCEVPG